MNQLKLANIEARYRQEYLAYKNAEYRCTHPDNRSYGRYGGRGILFNFKSFEEFLIHIGPKPSSAHSLDRINNDGHYELGNVRWATIQEQANNKCPYARHRPHAPHKLRPNPVWEAFKNSDRYKETIREIDAKINLKTS